MSTPPQPGMAAHLAAIAMIILVAILAHMLARRRADNRPFALGMRVIAAADLARLALSPVWAAHAGPYEGGIRVLFHADQALWLLWPATLAAMAVYTCAHRPHRRTILAASFGIALIGAVSGYPELRADALRRYYLALLILAVAADIAILVAWVRRRAPSAGPVPPAVSSLAVIVVVELVAITSGPWGRGLFGEAYALQHAAIIAGYTIIAAVQGGALAAGERS